jgi:hypothetical protein
VEITDRDFWRHGTPPYEVIGRKDFDMQGKLTPEQQRKAWDASVAQGNKQEDMVAREIDRALRKWCVEQAKGTTDIVTVAERIYHFVKGENEKSSGE